MYSLYCTKAYTIRARHFLSYLTRYEKRLVAPVLNQYPGTSFLHVTTQVGNDYVSSFVSITPDIALTHEGRHFTVTLPVRSEDYISVYRTDTNFSFWARVEDMEIDDRHARFQAASGGVYVVVKQLNLLVIIVGVVVTLMILSVMVIATVLYFKRYPEKMNACTRSFRHNV